MTSVWTILGVVLLAARSQAPISELRSILEKHESPLLTDYRLPGRDEVAPCWPDEPTKLPFAFKTDLNGDGLLDWAAMLLSVPAHSFQLVVLVGRQHATYECLVLEVSPWDADDYCIVEVPPGRYRTARGKGYELGGEHDHDPLEIELAFPGIDLEYLEAAAWFWFWDPGAKRFRKVQISD